MSRTPGGHQPPPGGELPLPPALEQALRQSPEARERFDALPPSHRREYVQWVSEARREEIRDRRAAQTVMRLLGPAGDA